MKTANLVRRYEYLTGSIVVYLPRSVFSRAYKYLMGSFVSQELLLAGILVNEARLGRNGYFKTSPKELRLA